MLHLSTNQRNKQLPEPIKSNTNWYESTSSDILKIVQPEKIVSLGLSEKMNELIQKNFGRESLWIVSENKALPKVVTPATRLLKEIAQYYKNKYQIYIELTDNIDELLKDYDKDEVIGIIFGNRNGDMKGGHVTPILYYPLKKQIVFLEVGGKVSFLFSLVYRLRSQGYECYEGMLERQADQHSCRTEAITILRNALLHVKYLKNHHHFLDLKSLLTLDKEGYLIPPEWDYTDQISNKSSRSKAAFVVHDYFSSNEEKQKNPRTVEAFRAQHSRSALFKNKLELSRNQEEKFSLLQELSLLQEQCPKDFKISSNEKGVIIEWNVEKTINSYLVYKGYSNARKRVPGVFN